MCLSFEAKIIFKIISMAENLADKGRSTFLGVRLALCYIMFKD